MDGHNLFLRIGDIMTSNSKASPASQKISHSCSAFAMALPVSNNSNGTYSPKNTAKRRQLRPTIMVSAIKAWAFQEKNGLKDFCLVRFKNHDIVLRGGLGAVQCIFDIHHCMFSSPSISTLHHYTYTYRHNAR